ncbi:MAG: MaoC family dehydratase, partial [Enterobacterales bacterium]|nr:MaoC family dehydratase [Enterobacterales bacterium]
MNSVQYTLADANRWAEFSGDYNPIHFDLEQARLRGEGLRVHGMRALLDIKQEIARAALGLDESAAYLRCVARLRQPVWCDTPYQLIRAGRKASIVHPDSGTASMSCQVSAVQSLVDGDNGESGTLEAVDIIRHGQTFSALQPHAQQWQFLDALLFRYLIHDSGLLRQQVLCHYFPENAQASFEAIFT